MQTRVLFFLSLAFGCQGRVKGFCITKQAVFEGVLGGGRRETSFFFTRIRCVGMVLSYVYVHNVTCCALSVRRDFASSVSALKAPLAESSLPELD